MPIEISESDGIGEFLQIEQMVATEDPDSLRRFARDFAKESPPPHKLRRDFVTSCIELSDDPEVDANPYPLDGLDSSTGAAPQAVYDSQVYDFEYGIEAGAQTKQYTSDRQDFLADLDIEEDVIPVGPGMDSQANAAVNGGDWRETGGYMGIENQYQSAPDFGETPEYRSGNVLSDSYFQAVEKQSDNYTRGKAQYFGDDDDEGDEPVLRFNASIGKNTLEGIETNLDATNSDDDEAVNTGTVVHLPKFLTLDTIDKGNTVVKMPKEGSNGVGIGIDTGTIKGIGRFLSTEVDADTKGKKPNREQEPDDVPDEYGRALDYTDRQSDSSAAKDKDKGKGKSKEHSLPPKKAIQQQSTPSYAPANNADLMIDEQLRLMEQEINKLTDMQREVDETLKKNAAEHREKMRKLEADKAEFDKLRKEEWAKLKKEKQQLDDRRTGFKDKDAKLKQMTADLEKLKADNQKLKEDMRRKDNNYRLTSEQLRSKIDSLTEENGNLKKRLEVSDKTMIDMRQKILSLEKANQALQSWQQSSNIPRSEKDLAIKNASSPSRRTHGAPNLMHSHADGEIYESGSTPTVENGQNMHPSTTRQTAARVPLNSDSQSMDTDFSRTIGHIRSEKLQKERLVSADTDYGTPKRPGFSATARPGSLHSAQREPIQLSNYLSSQAPHQHHRAPIALSGRSPASAAPEGIEAVSTPMRASTLTPPATLSAHSPENDEVLRHLPYKVPDDLFQQFNNSVLTYIKDAQVQEQRVKDQRIDKVLSSGAILTEFDNGTIKLHIPSRGETNIKFQNEDLKQIHSDGKIIYYYHDKKILLTTIPVALINPSAAVGGNEKISVYRFDSGQIEKHYMDNRKEVYYPDGSKKYVAANGAEHSIFADGTESHYIPDGNAVRQ